MVLLEAGLTWLSPLLRPGQVPTLLASLEQQRLKRCCTSKAGFGVKSALLESGHGKKTDIHTHTHINPINAVLPFAKLPNGRKLYLGTTPATSVSYSENPLIQQRQEESPQEKKLLWICFAYSRSVVVL